MRFQTQLLLTIDNPMLRFHRVHGQHILPGLAYIDLVYQVFARQGHDPLCLVLKKLAIFRPLAVSSDAEVLLSIDCEERPDGGWGVQIEASPNGAGADQRVRHVSLEVHREATYFPSERLDLASVRQAGPQAGASTDLADFYALCRKNALVHDGFMQARGRLHLQGDLAYADCQVGEEARAGASSLIFHPALLDGSVIALSAGMLLADPAAEPALYLPLYLAEFRATERLQAVCVARMARSSVESVNELRRTDIAFFNERGEQVAALSGLTTKKIGGADALAAQSAGAVARKSRPAAAAHAMPQRVQGEPIEGLLQRLLADKLKVDAERVNVRAGYHELGLSSASLLELIDAINTVLEIELPPTLLFEYTNVSELAGYLRAQHGERLPTPSVEASFAAPAAADATTSPAPPQAEDEPVAIVGMSARYPMARNLREFWANLRDGRDCITEVPRQRWRHESMAGLLSPSGKPISKWGGFIDDVDCFDPQFFRISPREAEGMDPQERLFLQACWEAIEDAGHTPDSLAPARGPNRRRRVGVFAGVMHKDYALMGAELNAHGQPWLYVQSNAGIANRVSYACGFHGPSMSVDTQCSSSLVALHLGVQSIRRGESDVAVVGGINLSMHPGKYMTYGLMDMHSSQGQCKSFADGADGYVSSEGIGVVVLKPLSRAQAEGDPIYGLIRATSSNHGGTVSGFTVPSPVAQADAIAECLSQARISPQSIGYVEAHGTGTSLGDPIEIEGLTKAYQGQTQAGWSCAIGSLKSNLGHAESAAGIGGLIKVALQLRHRWLVPSLHAEKLNPYIDWSRTPFRVQRQGEAWPASSDAQGRAQPRRAGLSSFGATGSNAHVIVEEYVPVVRAAEHAGDAGGAALVPLSAHTTEQLREYARALADALHEAQPVLAQVACTLQAGRVPQAARAAFVAHSLPQLIRQLDQFGRNEWPVEGAHIGEAGASPSEGFIDAGTPHSSLERLAADWVVGRASLDSLHASGGLPRVNLPTYPFAKERYWLPEPSAETGNGRTAALHPLLERNTSTLHALRFSTVLSGKEPFLADHQVGGRCILPGAAQIEMARAAAAMAFDQPVDAAAGWVLRDLVFASPVVVEHAELTLHIALEPLDNATLGFEIYSGPESGPTCHGSGTVSLGGDATAGDPILEDATNQRISGEDCYAAFRRRGLDYGPTHRAIQQIRVGTDDAGRLHVLADLSLQGAVQADVSRYVLHPGLMDAALQSTVGLMAETFADTVNDALWLPFAVDRLDVFSPLPVEALVRVRSANVEAGASVRKFNVDVADRSGLVCCRIAGLALRQFDAAGAMDGAASQSPLSTWEEHWVPQALQAGEPHKPQRIVCLMPEYGDRAGVASALARVAPNARLSFFDTPAQATEEGPIDVLLYLRPLSLNKLQNELLNELERPAALIRALVHSGTVCHSLVLAMACEDALARACADAWIGFERSSRVLLPEVTMKVVAAQGADWLSQVANELLAPDSGHVGYEQGVRKLLQLKPAPLAVANTRPIRRGGTYLVTGGMGALGEKLALHLAKQHAAQVVLMGRAPFDENKRLRLARIEAVGGRGLYVQADVALSTEVAEALSRIREHFGSLHGVFHAAGLLRPRSLVDQDPEDFAAMLAPKVQGTQVLEELLHGSGLDFICHFSSTSAVLGDMGVCAYAVANRFQSAIARWQPQQTGTRHVAIEWPLWKDGGIGVGDEEATARYLLTTGQRMLETAEAMELCERALVVGAGTRLAMAGDPARVGRLLTLLQGPAQATSPTRPSQPSSLDDGELRARTHKYLARELSAVLKLPAHRIDPHAAMDTHGIDSVMAIELTRALEIEFGRLSKTLFFEYRTLDALAGYLMRTHGPRLGEVLGGNAAQPEATPVQTTEAQAVVRSVGRAHRGGFTRRAEAPGRSKDSHALDIAIVGLSGRYPGAGDLTQFWQKLLDGADCIGEIPTDRWDHTRYFDAAGKGKAGTCYSQWGGFIEGVDEFDTLLFNVSPKDAAAIDPQERLFLQCAYSAIEDAGYTREALTRDASEPNVGVFVGVMWEEYQLYAAQSQAQGKVVTVMSNPSSVANRVSFWGNFNGPSMAVDTMCSSSLTAIHLACTSLQRGDCRVAVAGGVNLNLHPNKYLALSQAQFVSSEGLCRAFGVGGDGYVPAEGVGALLLKPLDQAIADGDQVYGVIKGSAQNHGGRTNGYTVPNPAAQQQVVRRALAQAGVPARAVSYVEAHGTGTALGDPIEIAGLTQAFDGPWTDGQTCAIGSVKSNIGHCESAAGISGLTKVLLQMKHQILVKSLHSEQLNPHIDFDQTPFSVLQEARAWQRPVVRIDGMQREFPRIAGLSSFGAGGSNVHMVIAEHEVHDVPAVAGRQLVVLSARTPQALEARIDQLLRAIESGVVAEGDFASMAYVLQVGREAMEHRVALVASTLAEVSSALSAHRQGEAGIEALHAGQVSQNKEVAGLFAGSEELRQASAHMLAQGKLDQVADLWTRGVRFDWELLHTAAKPRRMSLPTYPFARDKYWAFDRQAVLQPVAVAEIPHRAAPTASSFSDEAVLQVLDGLEASKLDLDRADAAVRDLMAGFARGNARIS